MPGSSGRRRIFRTPRRVRPCGRRLLERGLDHIAIGVVGHQRRKGSLAGSGGVIDDAVDVGLRQEAQEIHAAAGDAGIGRERNHGHAAGARELRGRGNRKREQRSENDLGAFVSACWVPGRRLRTAAVVLDQELDVGVLEFGQRHFGGVLHRLRGDAGIAGGRQRQDQADLDLPGADRERLLLRAGRARSGWAKNGLENWLKLCCTLAQAPSSGAPRMRPIAVRRVAPAAV